MTPRQIAQEVYDRAHERAAGIVATGEEHAPIMLVLTKDGGGGVFPAFMLPDKDAIAEAHRRIGADAGVRCACLIMEAWTYQATPGDRAAQAVLDHKVAVRDLPLRRECITFNLRVGRAQFFAHCLIDRASGSLEKSELFDPGAGKPWKVQGRFIGDGGGP